MRPPRLASSLALLALASFVAGCGAGGTAGSPRVPGGGGMSTRPSDVTGTNWRWQDTTTPTETVACVMPERYVVQFAPSLRLAVLADCNRGWGTYDLGEGTVRVEAVATSRMFCGPASQDARFLRDLQQATTFWLDGRALFLKLPGDAATMRFLPAP